MFSIIQANSKSHCDIISVLASEIWKEHYTPIIGIDQVDYMLEKFQSSEVIYTQIQNGKSYYLIQTKELFIGYFCVYPEDGSLFLSKLYILMKFRGQGAGKFATDFIHEQGRELALTTIFLTVNINNTIAITSYEKMGFINQGPTKADIGAGYVMDDYRMVKKID
jgi:ribosomal protein S18 acetylase RimI-like enzyme